MFIVGIFAVIYSAKWAYFDKLIEFDWVPLIIDYFNQIVTTQRRVRSYRDDRDVFELDDNVEIKMNEVIGRLICWYRLESIFNHFLASFACLYAVDAVCVVGDNIDAISCRDVVTIVDSRMSNSYTIFYAGK